MTNELSPPRPIATHDDERSSKFMEPTTLELVRDLLRQRFSYPERVNTCIDPKDEMFLHTRAVASRCRPQGKLDRVSLDDTLLTLCGGATCSAYSVEAVEVYLNGQLVESVTARMPRPHAKNPAFKNSGWRCHVSLALSDSAEDERLTILIRSSTGRRGLLFSGTVADAIDETS